MNIENAIEIIKTIDALDDYELQEAIETIFKELKHLQKENEELKEKNKLLQENYTKCFEDLNWCLMNYIHKDKIKEKIEEIKARMNDDCIALHEFQRIAKIDVLEDLLKKE